MEDEHREAAEGELLISLQGLNPETLCSLPGYILTLTQKCFY